MKKLSAILVLTIFNFCALSAQKLNTAQQKLKTDIFNFLKKEVTNLTDYSATDLKFSYNGTTYFVSVSESDYAPMYVTLYAGFNMPSDYDKDIVAKAGQQLNLYKGVKFYSGDDFVKFQAEMFLNDEKPFSVAFRSLISVMGTMKSAFDDEYEKAKKLPSVSSNFTSQFKRNTSGVHIWPPSVNKTDSKLYVAKVTITKDYTLLDMVSYNGGQYQNCAIDRNSYITAFGKKYTLTRAEGISYAPKYTDYPDYKSGYNVPLSFKLYFPAIPQNVKSIDFAETGDGWKISSINLDDSNVINAESEWIETTSHKWKVISVRCESDKTILQKKYIPKDELTYVYSSQEEYIEDADTGRKYYLRHSDIGFESDSYIARGKTEHYFNEEYPVLPASVKRINISSGSQYYIKGLQIR